MDLATSIGELPAAAWPVALSMASVVACGRVRESRRRARLNRGLHELRRPLQALALGAGPPTSTSPAAAPRSAERQWPLELALAALSDLDREINDERAPVQRRRVACRALVEAAIDRWRGPAARVNCAITLGWKAGEATVVADPAQVGRALDNLLANAIEHGGLRVEVAASRIEGGVRIAIANDLPAGASGEARPAGAPPTGIAARLPSRRPRRDPRRGHGLAIVGEIAACHQGRFALRSGPGRALAILELPLAPPPPAAA